MSALSGCEPIANSPANPHALKYVPILVLNVHSRCNCRCVMCDIWKRTETEELTHAALSRHLSNFREMGVESIVFSGGEPLMHSDFVRIAELFRSEGIRLTLSFQAVCLKQNWRGTAIKRMTARPECAIEPKRPKPNAAQRKAAEPKSQRPARP